MGCQGSKAVSYRAKDFKSSAAVAQEVKPATVLSVARVEASPGKIPAEVTDETSTTPSVEHIVADSDSTSDIEDDVPTEGSARTRQVSSALALARNKYSELDVNGAGVLRREGLQSLALWLFDRFHPGGEGLNAMEMRKIEEYLSQECADRGGAMTFKEFVEWHLLACEEIARMRRVAAWLQQEQQDGVRFSPREFEVIVVKSEETSASDYSNPSISRLSPAAQTAIKRHNDHWFFGC